MRPLAKGEKGVKTTLRMILIDGAPSGRQMIMALRPEGNH